MKRSLITNSSKQLLLNLLVLVIFCVAVIQHSTHTGFDDTFIVNDGDPHACVFCQSDVDNPPTEMLLSYKPIKGLLSLYSSYQTVYLALNYSPAQLRAPPLVLS